MRKKFEKSLLDELAKEFEKTARVAKKISKGKGLSKIISVPKVFEQENSKEKSKLSSLSYQSKNVVVKNIANMGKGHFAKALAYAIKNAEMLMSDGGDNIFDSNDREYLLNEIQNDWKADIENTNNNGKVALHLVFSIDEPKSDENKKILLKSAQESLENILGGEYSYVLATHSHQNKLHCHAIINKTNKFTNKKLHFKSKNDCRNFFFDLREEFKEALLLHSKGRLRYDNLYRYQRDVYQKELEQIEYLTNPSIKKDDFNFDKTFGKIFDSMINQQNKSSLSNNDRKNLTKNIEILKVWNQNIKETVRTSSKLKQKEILIKHILQNKNIKKFLTKDNINKLQNLAFDVEFAKNDRNDIIKNLTQGFSTTQKVINKKTNIFVLQPMVRNLQKFRNVAKDAKTNENIIKQIDDNILALQNYIKARLAFLLESLQKGIESENEIKDEHYKRFVKNLNYIIKEIQYGKELLDDTQLAHFSELVSQHNNIIVRKESANIHQQNNILITKQQQIAMDLLNTPLPVFEINNEMLNILSGKYDIKILDEKYNDYEKIANLRFNQYDEINNIAIQIQDNNKYQRYLLKHIKNTKNKAVEITKPLVQVQDSKSKEIKKVFISKTNTPKEIANER